MRALLALARRLLRARRGAVVVEAAIMLPMIALTAGAGYDIARYLQLSARADRVAIGLADMVARAESVRDRTALDAGSQSNDLGVFFDLAKRLAAPETFDNGGGVAVHVVTGGDDLTVHWSRADGIDASTERLGAITGLPADVDFVVVEAALPFTAAVIGNPTLLDIVGVDPMVRRFAAFRPRVSNLADLEPAS